MYIRRQNYQGRSRASVQVLLMTQEHVQESKQVDVILSKNQVL